MSVLIKDAYIVTQNHSREIVRGDILVDKGIIKEIGQVRGGADTEIDASGDIVIPGLINTHTHVSMSLMKGIADDLPFPQFLDRMFAVDARRTAKDIDAGTRLGCLEMIRSGTTTFVDLYYSADVIARATQDAGIRGVLAWTVLDAEYTTQKGKPLDNCRDFCERFKNEERIIPAVGLQGVYVCSTETFKAAQEYALQNDLLLTFHLSETRKEVNDCKKREGMRPADYLNAIGFLNDHCLAAHSAWLTINEVRAMGATGTKVSTCAISNMKLATGGVAPLPEMFNENVVVSLGTDSSTTNNSLDMWGEMKTLALLQKASRWDPTVLPAQRVLDLATIEGARAIRMEKDLGSIEVGKKADLVVIEGKAPNLRPLYKENLVSNLVYAASAFNVKTVLCEGKLVMENRKVRTLNQDQTMVRAEEMARELLNL